MNLILKLLAFLVLALFLGVLIWKVPRFDLGAVIAITLLLAARDFFWNPSASKR